MIRTRLLASLTGAAIALLAIPATAQDSDLATDLDPASIGANDVQQVDVEDSGEGISVTVTADAWQDLGIAIASFRHQPRPADACQCAGHRCAGP